MNWLTSALAFLGAAAFFMAIWIIRLDPRSSLNRKIGASLWLVSVYELASSLLVAAPDASWYWPCLRIASSIYLFCGPTILMALLDFCGIRKRRLTALLLAPVIALSLVQLVQLWTGTWVIAGYHPTRWGNVNVLTQDEWPKVVNQVYSTVEGLVGVVALIFAWRRSQSRRYRKIALAILALSVLVNLWGIYAGQVIWLSRDLPDPTGIGAGLMLIGYGVLIERYRHLSERHPDLSGPLLADLKGSAFFVDAEGMVIKASEKAARILGQTLVGHHLLELLPGWPGLAEGWASLKEARHQTADLPGTIGSRRLSVHLLPHLNPFDEFDGALVSIVAEGILDERMLAFGLSAREQEVARLVCGGFDTKQIADGLCISTSTVKSHLHKVYEKTGTTGRPDLILALLTEDGT
jgi:Response regulator containing a CheY-like receiver domain and an HTH DNA-binding domain